MKKRKLSKLSVPRDTIRDTIRKLTALGDVRAGVECSTSGYTKYDCDPPVVTP